MWFAVKLAGAVRQFDKQENVHLNRTLDRVLDQVRERLPGLLPATPPELREEIAGRTAASEVDFRATRARARLRAPTK